MKRIIVDLERLVLEGIPAGLGKDVCFYAFCKKDASVTVKFSSQLKEFAGVVHFVECDPNKRDICKAYLMGNLATSKDEVIYVGLSLPLEAIEEHVKFNYKTVETIAQACGKRAPKKVETKKETAVTPKKEKPSAKEVIKKAAPKSSRKKKGTFESEVKRIMPEFTGDMGILKNVFEQSMSDITLDMICRMHFPENGNEIAEKLKPEFKLLKSLV